MHVPYLYSTVRLPQEAYVAERDAPEGDPRGRNGCVVSRARLDLPRRRFPFIASFPLRQTKTSASGGGRFGSQQEKGPTPVQPFFGRPAILRHRSDYRQEYRNRGSWASCMRLGTVCTIICATDGTERWRPHHYFHGHRPCRPRRMRLRLPQAWSARRGSWVPSHRARKTGQSGTASGAPPVTAKGGHRVAGTVL
jgi:hypothetical protein